MSHRRLFFTIAAIFFLILTGHWFGFFNAPENFLRRIFSPFSQAAYSLGRGWEKFSEPFVYRRALETDKETCQSQLRQSYLNQTELALLQQENQSLRAQLNFLKNAPAAVMAEIVGQSNDQTMSALFINRGEADGLKIGEPVVAENGFLVGRLIKVEKNLSVIQLITDNQSREAAMILNQEKTQGVVEGEHGLSLKMTMIPQNEMVKIDDLIVTSGLESNLPRGLIIGQVETIQKELYEPFQSALLRPLIDLNRITIVSILKIN